MKVRAKDIHFSYGGIKALQGVSMDVWGQEVVSLVGPNGSGKTTFLKCINKLLRPQQGTILVAGRDVKQVGLKELARLLGYVPQSGNHAFPSTVFDTVLLGRRPHMNWGVGARDKEIVSRMLVLMGLQNIALRQFTELSGGERQKVLIARALAQEPEVLLLDEPTSNLDLRHQLEVLSLVRAAVQEKGVSAVMAIHDLNLASRFSDRIVFLKDGMVYAVGKPGEVLNRDNIAAVYGVETIINKDSGRPYIIPVGPV